MGLAEMQRTIGLLIFNPLTKNYETAHRLPNGLLSKSVAASLVKPTSRLSSLDRIGIYNRQYWYRLIDCLYDDFPGLRRIIGAKKFEKIVRLYLGEYPSRSFALRDLGENMVPFLESQRDLLTRRYHAAIEMAQFEWAQVVAFDGEASEPITHGAIQNIAPEELRFSLQPYVTLLELSFPCDDMVLELKRTESHRSEAAKGDHELQDSTKDGFDNKPITLPRRKQRFIAVHRFNNILHYKELPKSAFTILRYIADGQSVTVACENSLSSFSARSLSNGHATKQIQQWFCEWRELEWLCLRT